MSIRTRNIHFTNWAKVIEALADKGVTVADESAARTFLTETSSDANPYYYYVGYIKDTQEIYTHGKFYKGSDSLYDDTELRDLIGTKADLSALEALISEVEENEEVTAAALTELHENKADKSEIPDVSTFATKDELNTLSAEVEEKVDSATFTTLSETVAGYTTSITNLESNKADKTDLEDYAAIDDLNTKQDLLVSGTNIKTVNNNSILGSGNIETPDTKVTSAANHYGYNSNNATSTTGAFVTKITKDGANHVTSFESRSLTATDIPSLDASKITSGTISIERLPAGALERMFVVESETAAMSATIQEGDVVQVTGNNNKMYFCISDTATTFATKFKEFTAGTATSVPWSGITNKPTGIDGWGDRITVIEGDYLSKTATATNSAALNGYGFADANGRNGVIVSPAEGYIEVGRALDFHLDTSGIDYSTRLRVTGNNNNVVDLPSGSGILALVSQIPTNNSQLTNGAGYITSASIPTKLSQLTDDVVRGNYLPLTGGTVSGVLSVNSILKFSDVSGNYKVILQRDSNDNVLFGGDFSSHNMYIDCDVLRVRANNSIFTNNITAPDFVTTSDNRLKDFVSDIYVDFESLKQIPKKYYYWKDKSMGEDLQLGTSAQELAKIYPECVSYDEKEDKYSVSYQKLSIVALAAIDKLHDRISELESKLYD